MRCLQAIVLLSVVSACLTCNGNIPCHWKEYQLGGQFAEFEAFAQKVIAADRNEQMYCRSLSSPQITEVHTQNFYQIAVPATDGDYEVRVKGRTLLVFAPDCVGSVSQVRTLPSYVDAYRGTWTVIEEGLVITFPTKFNLAHGGGTCCDPMTYSTTLRQAS